MRKVFFEIVDSSAGEEAENPNVAPTLAAIPEAISADPVFQVLPFLKASPSHDNNTSFFFVLASDNIY